MALTRLYSFLTGSVITNAIITGEFDNIYNNALTLISPLTGNLAAGGFRITGLSTGSLASPSLQFTSDADTGVYSPAADQVAVVCAGAAAANFTTGAVGPHVIGSGTTNTRYALLLTGTSTLSGATQEAGFATTQALTNASGVNLYGTYIAPTLTNAAGATTTMAFQTIDPSALTITGGSVTNAAGLYITGAPSGATNNYALWVAGGNSRFDGGVILTAALSGSNTGLGASGAGGDLRFYNNGTQNMVLTSGILAIGTTVTTNASSGDLVLAYGGAASNIRWVNSGATGSRRVLSMQTLGGSIDTIVLGDSSNNPTAFGHAARTAAAVAANFTADFYILFKDNLGNNFYIPGRNAAW